MSVQQIKSLLAVPDWGASNDKGVIYLNDSVPTLDSLDQLETLLQKAHVRHEDLQARVRGLTASSSYYSYVRCASSAIFV